MASRRHDFESELVQQSFCELGGTGGEGLIVGEGRQVAVGGLHGGGLPCPFGYLGATVAEDDWSEAEQSSALRPENGPKLDGSVHAQRQSELVDECDRLEDRTGEYRRGHWQYDFRLRRRQGVVGEIDGSDDRTVVMEFHQHAASARSAGRDEHVGVDPAPQALARIVVEEIMEEPGDP
jgi:hypothetical protein